MVKSEKICPVCNNIIIENDDKIKEECFTCLIQWSNLWSH